MEKVSAMKKIALFLTTKRVARPMKFAAFISIIISVAVMLAACQSAVGPEGPQGPKGDKGDKGGAGDTGQDGISALVKIATPDPILINDLDKRGVADIGALPAPFSASRYFTGGTGVKFSLVKTNLDDNPDTPFTAVLANSVFTVALADGLVTVAKRSTGVVDVEATDAISTDGPHYGAGTQFVIKATDSLGNSVASDTISVKRNRTPRTSMSSYAAVTVGTNAGLAAGFLATTPSDTDKANPCNQMNMVCVALPGATGSEHFPDEDHGDLTYSASSDDASSVSATVDGSQVTLAGISAGVDDDGNPTLKTVVVDISATDAGSLTSDPAKGISVTVDPAPMQKPGTVIVPLKLKADGMDDQAILRNVSQFFIDNVDSEGNAITLVYSAEEVSDPSGVISNLEVDAGVLQAQGDGAGTATIKLIATEPYSASDTDMLGQSGEVTITVTVEQ